MRQDIRFTVLTALGVIVALVMIAPAAAAKEMSAGKPTPIVVPNIQHAGPVDFEKELLPALSTSCLACHNKTKARAGLVLETPGDIRKGSDNGQVIIPGKSAESLLLKAASHAADVDQSMPPHDNKVAAPNLTPEQLGLLRLWIDQGATGEVRGSLAPLVWQALPADFDPIYAVSISSDGRSAACGRANRIDVYDFPSGRLAARLSDPRLAGARPTAHRDMVESLAFSPDGTLLASGSYREIKFWRRSESITLTELGDKPVACIASSFDGALLATTSADGVIHLFNAATFKPIGDLTGHQAAVTCLRFSQDGTKLLSASRDKTIRVWDVAGLKPFGTIELPVEVLSVCWAALGRQIAAGGPDGVIRLWKIPDTAGGDMVAAKELKGHEGPVNALDTLFGDVNHLVSGGQDGTVRRWNIESGTASKRMLHGGPVVAVIARKDGKRFVSLGVNGVAKLWNIDDLQTPIVLKCTPIGTARPTDQGAPEPVKSADRNPPGAGGSSVSAPVMSPIRAVAFSTEGSLIAMIGDEGILRIFSSEKGALSSSTGDGKTPGVAVAFAGAGRAIACGAGSPPAISESTSFWKLERTIGNAESTSPLSDRVTSLDFSPNGLLLASGGGVPTRSGEIRLFDVATGSVKSSFDNVHSDTVLCVRFSPDGARLASSSADRFVRVVDIGTGKVLHSLEGHGGHALGVAWSRNGRTLASSGADNELRFWNADSGDRGKVVQGFDKEVTAVVYVGASDNVIAAAGDGKIRQIKADGSDIRSFGSNSDFVYSLSATLDGGTLIAGGQDGVLRAWDIRSGQAIGSFLPPDRK